MSRFLLVDAQSALSFLVQQASFIEAEVVRIQYPEIQYPQLVPVDTTGDEWAKSITFFSIEKVGQAAWFNAGAKDVPLADIQKSKFEQGVEMAAIGYRYNLEELGHAMRIPGLNLTNERAEAARRAYEEFMETLVFTGNSDKDMTGLINDPNVTQVYVQADGGKALGDTDGSPDWMDKNADQILRDVNDLLTGVVTSTSQVEVADTLLLPLAPFSLAATKRIDSTTMTVMQFLQQYNAYTAMTGQPLTIRVVRELATAGNGGTGRMVAYRRDPRVLKLHLPMPHRFLPVWQTGPLVFDVPGIFRTGGVEIRRPGSVRYADGLIDAEYQ